MTSMYRSFARHLLVIRGVAAPVCGAAAALYLARVLCETTFVPWPGRWLALLLLGSAVVGGYAGKWLLPRLQHYWPLLSLAIYVLYPGTSQVLALGVFAFTILLLLLVNVPDSGRRAWPEIAAGLMAFVLYVRTLAPGVLAADAGEFQLVSDVLGIAHPPGYPLYTMLGKLATLIPWGDPAWRVNLLSALFSASTVVVVVRSVRRRTGSAAMGLLSAGALAISTTFWVQATTANVRSLTALFTALLFALLLRWEEDRTPRRLGAVGICFGLAVGHHASLAPFALPIAAFVLACDPSLVRKPKQWGVALAGFAVSFLVLLYLPVRSLMGPAFDPAPIRSISDFIAHVTASGFGGDMFYYSSLPDVWPRVQIWAQILRLEFGVWLLAAMGVASVVLIAKRRGLAVLLLGCLVVNTALAVTYRAPQTTEYLMPSYVCLAMVLGFGLAALRSLVAKSWANSLGAVVVAGLAVAVLWNGAANYPSLAALHDDSSTHDRAETLLCEAPQDALILANWHWATPLWYLQQVEGMRPDVLVEYVYPEGSTPNEDVWLRRVGDGLSTRPVIVTNRFYAYEQSGYTFVPLEGAWLALDAPLTEPPETYSTVNAAFDDGITLLGYRISADTLAPGDTLTVCVYWRVGEQIQRDYASFAQLIGPSGVVGQGDISHRSTEYLPGTVRVDSYRIPTLLHTAPGEFSLITGFYSVTDMGWERLLSNGADHIALTSVQIQAASSPLASVTTRDIRLSGGLQITGTDIDDTVAGQRRFYVHVSQRSEAWLDRGPWASTPSETRVLASNTQGPLAETVIPALEPGSALCVALDLPAGTRDVRLTFVRADGQPLERLGPAHVALGTDINLALTGEVSTYIPLGGEMVFVGWKDLPDAAPRGQDVTLSPRFLTLRPLVADYSVSAGLSRPDLGWEAKSDSTPALGAIPTLKWVRGWQVTDRHILSLDEVSPGSAICTLTVYDAFTLEPLSVLDERLVRAGQGVTPQTGAVSIVD